MEELINAVIPRLVPIATYVGVLLVMSALIWFGTEGLGSMSPSNWTDDRRRLLKKRTKFVVGILIGFAAYGAGWLPSPSEIASGTPAPAREVSGWILAGVMSWLAAFGVGRIHDRVIKPRTG